MDYSRPELADKLAAEYALGTLRGAARSRYETLLLAHPRLRQAKWEWENRVGVLGDSTPEVKPSAQVWSGIERRLFADRRPASTGPLARWWLNLGLWQGITAVATVAAVSLGVVASQPAPVQTPILVVMDAQSVPANSGVQAASFVASVGGDGRSMVVRPLNPSQQVALNKALELWALPAQGEPRSLGLVSQGGSTTVMRAQLLQGTTAFALSVEPQGGSPTGAPTGPVVSVGKLQL